MLAGYLVPILPLAVIGLLRWQGLWPKLLALSSLGCGLAAALLSYSRGGWIGLLLALGSLGLLLLLRQSRRLGPPDCCSVPCEWGCSSCSGTWC